MQAVILLAGHGSRLNRQDLPHKSLLPFGDETLLQRHLVSLKQAGIQKVHLVLGHNGDRVREHAESLGLALDLHCIDNPVYLTTGNTLSMVMGLRFCPGDAIILDGDVLYPKNVFVEYVHQSKPTSFALIASDIDNAESAKVLLKPSGTIHAFITKRHLTETERKEYRFGGEAIGFFKLSQVDVKKFLKLYAENEAAFEKTLWEIPFTEFAKQVDLHPWNIKGTGCFEIDTQEDYDEALASFKARPGIYG